jgi:hypothetical protein
MTTGSLCGLAEQHNQPRFFFPLQQLRGVTLFRQESYGLLVE